MEKPVLFIEIIQLNLALRIHQRPNFINGQYLLVTKYYYIPSSSFCNTTVFSHSGANEPAHRRVRSVQQSQVNRRRRSDRASSPCSKLPRSP